MDEWVAPELIEDVSVPTVLQNFEDLVQKLVAQPDVEWTTVEGLSLLYGRRPARVADDVVIRGAEEAVSHGAPTFTAELSAGELLYLLARHALSPEETYDVPQVMGPLQNTPDHLERECVHCSALPEEIASEMLTACDASGYMPAVFCEARGGASRRAKLY